IVTWNSLNQDGSGWGIYAQRYNADGTPWLPQAIGTAGDDAIDLNGNTTAVEYLGLAGNDTLKGGSGNDRLIGGAGMDTFVFAGNGNGIDTIVDFETGDLISVAGANFSSPVVAGDGSDTGQNQVQISSADGHTTLYIGTDASAGADVQVRVAGTLAVTDLRASGTYIGLNTTLMVANPIADQNATEDSAFTFTVPADAFAHALPLTLSAAKTNGDPLPAWLTFDGSSGTFTGTPTNGEVGNFAIRVTAIDSGNAIARDEFALTIANSNDAPTVANPIADQIAAENQPFALTVPMTTFADVDVGDTLALSATLANGAALPAWIGFDPATRTFSGIPARADATTLQVKVTAVDGTGAGTSDVFQLRVYANTYTPPNSYVLLIGDSTNNVLVGTPNNDLLDGLAGADDMSGGEGSDAYVVDNAGDLVTENPDEGTDGVRSAIAYTLPDNVENLTLTGSSNVNGIGNGADNVILGNAGANRLEGLGGNDSLDGGAGADVLIGGSGDDAYFVDNAADVVIESSAAGLDRVFSAVSIRLPANVENLTLIGSAPISAFGNELDNAITGNGASNVIDGDAGNDILQGGAGNDIYVIASAKHHQQAEIADASGTDEVRFASQLPQSTLTLYAGDTGIERVVIGTGTAAAAVTIATTA
ncbi:putative Ig domain-containing protein, partial [Sulfurisoma sediminicola]